MRRVLGLICLISCVRSVTGRPPPANAGSRGLVACYALGLGAWSHPFPSGWPAIHIPPDTVRLDTLLVAGRLGARGMRILEPNIPAIAALPRNTQPFWTRLADDSLRLTWSTGFSGVSVHLAQHGDSVAGVARANYDVIGRPIPVAEVVGWRVPCSRTGD